MCKDRHGSAMLARRALLVFKIATGLLPFSLVTLPTSADAATFDQKVSAPRELSSAALKAKAGDYFAAFENDSTTTLDATKDRVRHAQWFDLRWQLGRAIDGRRSLDALAEYGIISEGNGQYSVDLERFPQWDPLEAKMRSFLSAGPRDATMSALKQRGFRDKDIEVLQEYLSRHNPDLAAIAETAPLTESFAVGLRKRAAGGQRLNTTEMMAYTYQMARSVSGAYRTWALGVLSSLDHQRQMILVSYLMESRSVMGIAASDPEVARTELETFLISGEYARATERQIRAIQAEEEQVEVEQ